MAWKHERDSFVRIWKLIGRSATLKGLYTAQVRASMGRQAPRGEGGFFMR
jgi:hypothetical protein